DGRWRAPGRFSRNGCAMDERRRPANKRDGAAPGAYAKCRPETGKCANDVEGTGHALVLPASGPHALCVLYGEFAEVLCGWKPLRLRGGWRVQSNTASDGGGSGVGIGVARDHLGDDLAPLLRADRRLDARQQRLV